MRNHYKHLRNAKKGPSPRPRRLALINASTGERIGIYDDVVAEFKANAEFQKTQTSNVITIIKEADRAIRQP